MARFGNLPVGLGGFGLILVVWWSATSLSWVSTEVIPSPQMVASALATVSTQGFADATLAAHLGASLVRLGAAFAIAAALGLPLGLLIGWSRSAREIIDPWIQLYRPVPSLAYLGLIVLWLGVGETSRVVLLALAGLPPIALGLGDAVHKVRIERVQGARSLGVSGFRLLAEVVIPSCVPGALSAMRIAMTGIFTTLIAAEMIGARQGLGVIVMTAGYDMRLGMVVVGLLFMGLIGTLIDQAFRWIEREAAPWRGRF